MSEDVMKNPDNRYEIGERGRAGERERERERKRASVFVRGNIISNIKSERAVIIRLWL